MRSKKSSYLYVFLLLATALILYPNSFIEATGIVDSGHNLLRQSNYTDPDAGKAGVCSFCHIPHSTGTKGMDVTTQPGSTHKLVTGAVGAICSSCHGVTSGKGLAPIFTQSNNPFLVEGAIYNHPLRDNDSDQYGTDRLATFDVNANVNTGTFGGTKQWMSGWPATGKLRRGLFELGDTTMIECTSCHNVHAVTPGLLFDEDKTLNGTGASKRFLRAKPFDTTNPLGDEADHKPDQNILNPKQIYCEYCHIGRSRMGTGPWNTTTIDLGLYSTHPVGVPTLLADINAEDQRQIYDDDKGWDSSVVIDPIFRTGDTCRVQDGGRMGHLGFIGKASAVPSGMGYGTTRVTGSQQTLGVVICQSCHQPHSSLAFALPGQRHDQGAITDNSMMFEEDKQDLLAEPNNAGSGGSAGYNRLCENCHSYRPFLALNAFNRQTGDASNLGGTMNGHPLKHHHYGAGSYPATVNWAEQTTPTTCMDTDDQGGASITIPTTWPTGGAASTNEVVCLSCHELHGARPRTKLLRAVPLCVECHDGPINKLGVTHPVQVNLSNADGGTWPDQSSFSLFTPPQYETASTYRVIRNPEKVYPALSYTAASSYNVLKGIMINNPTVIRIDCGTCHDYINGNIHYDIARRRDPQGEVNPDADPTAANGRYETTNGITYNARRHRHYPTPVIGGFAQDPNSNSEICVACHTADNFGYLDDNTIVDRSATPQTGREGYYGISANPSFWIKEYAQVLTGDKLVGGSFDGNGRPVLSALGSRPMERDVQAGLSDRTGTHAAGVRVTLNAENSPGKKTRQTWIYVGKWGDSTVLDPVYTNSPIEACRRSFTGKYSKWGPAIDNLGADRTVRQGARTSANIICQSCHIPHYAAAGLVEYNSGALKREASPHSALLLATQAESFMCRNCHDIGGGVVHPITQPTQPAYIALRDLVSETGADTKSTYYDSTIWVGGRKGMRHSDLEHPLRTTLEFESWRVSEYTAPFYLRSDMPDTGPLAYLSLDAGGYRWGLKLNQGPAKPANYPRAGGSLSSPADNSFPSVVNRGLPGMAVDTTSTSSSTESLMTCDSCHAPHAAGTVMGTYCLEGNDSTVPKVASPTNKRDWPLYYGVGASQPSYPNDAPTCILCHIQ